MLTAIIVAAGSSLRMGFDKLMAPLGDKTVLDHAVDAFEHTASVTEIIVVARPDRVDEFQQLLCDRKKLRGVVAGGEHRQDSVRAGLQRVAKEARYIAVHDAARPLVRPDQIESVYRQAREMGAASLASPITDTLKRVDEHMQVIESVDRKNMCAMETPQIFAREILEEGYERVAEQGLQITDEVSAVEALGHKVVLVPSGDFNFKITYERDLALAEMILRQRAASR
jgi:2-C-methyl-D-erythritol 4-phosphate cytidylyltransferase